MDQRIKNLWFEVDVDKINKGKMKEVRGVALKVYMSPFEVPRATRGYKDDTTGKFTIEFRYITKEPTRKKKQSELITLHVGRRSGMLYRIDIDVDKIGASAVTLEVLESAIDEVGKLPGFADNDNYLVAQSAANWWLDALKKPQLGI